MDINNLNEEHFISYISNIYIQINRAMVFKELDKINHFVGDELYTWLEDNIDDLSNDHKMQHYFDMSVAHVELLNVNKLDDSVQIEVELISGYGKFVSPTHLYGTEIKNHMVFEKRKDSRKQPAARYCPGCGSNIDVNRSGVCDYCGTTYNLEDMDWILVKYERS